jgi:two-component system phosphate regulon response regulator PhoB
MSDRVATGADRVLVVDDDVSMRRALTELLRREGFDVIGVATGAQAMAMASDCSLIVLDVGLPDISGFDVLRSIRSHHDIPVIVLSGRTSESDRVLGLELGADDYVLKPFLPREVVARVRRRLRGHRGGDGDEEMVDGPLRIDLRSREVFLADDRLQLTAKEFDLLAHLASQPRRAISRSQLLSAVWESSPDWQSETTVTEHVRRLRTKVGADRIITVRGVGYRYEPTV